jgi:hypothetical protein
MFRYDYDRGYRGRRAAGYRDDTRDRMPRPSAWVPGAFLAGAPMYGWGWWGGAWGWPQDPMIDEYSLREYEASRRVRPEESGTYGRHGDEAARRWAQRYGYDVEMTMRPSRRSPGRRSRYDSGF